MQGPARRGRYHSSPKSSFSVHVFTSSMLGMLILVRSSAEPAIGVIYWTYPLSCDPSLNGRRYRWQAYGEYYYLRSRQVQSGSSSSDLHMPADPNDRDSLGAIFSLFLQKSKRTTLSTVARSNYENVKSEGMKVEGPQPEGGGVIKFDHVFRALDSSIESPPHDEPLPLSFSYIVVTTKLLSFAMPSLVECLEPFVVPGKSVLVLIQNGVGIEDEIQNRWPENLVITCVVRCSAKMPLRR